jgi:hypothetical protein
VLFNESGNSDINLCLIKKTTGIPCPSCGSTRAVVLISQGDFIQALHVNPIGFIVVICMLLIPIGLFVDLLTRRKTLFDFYLRTEAILRKPGNAIMLAIIVTMNWIWNIFKGL